jgi:hypothetical protein
MTAAGVAVPELARRPRLLKGALRKNLFIDSEERVSLLRSRTGEQQMQVPL